MFGDAAGQVTSGDGAGGLLDLGQRAQARGDGPPGQRREQDEGDQHDQGVDEEELLQSGRHLGQRDPDHDRLTTWHCDGQHAPGILSPLGFHSEWLASEVPHGLLVQVHQSRRRHSVGTVGSK